MAIPSTVDEIKMTCKTTLPDSVVEGIICMVNERVGQCLTQTYPECTATNIFDWMVCHFIEAMQGGSITQKKAANGASISITQYGSGEGLKATPFGRMVIMADIQGCYSNLVADTFLFGVVGDPTRSDYSDQLIFNTYESER